MALRELAGGKAPDDEFFPLQVVLPAGQVAAGGGRSGPHYCHDIHRKPLKVATPKLHQILARFKPRIVIVQLGTNWMDQLMKSMDPKGAEYKNTIRSFIHEIRSRGPVQIVWILPPDASKYRQGVKDAVDRWIKECAREMDFQTIDSRALTSRYMLGKSGSDGVHLNDSAASEWANASTKRLQRLYPALR